jgi:beta-galactosidase
MNISSYLPHFKSNSEYLADIHFLLAENTPWAPKGFEVASNQFALTGLARQIPSGLGDTFPSFKSDSASYIFAGKNFQIAISKTNGALTSYKWNGKEQIIQPLLPHFRRPLTDNDRRGWKPDKKLHQWYDADLKLTAIKCCGFSDGFNGNGSVIASNYSLINDSATVQVVYNIYNNGLIGVDYYLKANPALPKIPKIGLQCGIERSFGNITWYGKGPMENYIDRNVGFDAAIYSQNIFDFMEPYAVPQENGNRTDVRWMFLSNKNNEGLLIVADSLLSMSAWPYTEGNIETAKHTIDLKDAGYITLNIDLVQMGVGGNDSWSDVAAPLEKYQIPAKDYRYRFYLLPYKKRKEQISAVARGLKY